MIFLSAIFLYLVCVRKMSFKLNTFMIILSAKYIYDNVIREIVYLGLFLRYFLKLNFFYIFGIFVFNV